MPARVDLKEKIITSSISDLVEPLYGAGRSLGLMQKLRADLGRQVHRRYQERRSREESFTAEHPVELVRKVDGFTVRISGRLDGLIDEGGGWIAEEAKSVSYMGRQFHGLRPKDVPDYALQLRLYGLCLARGEEPKPLTLRLVLYSLVDEVWREIPVRFDPAETEAELDELLRRLIREAREAAERAKRRRRCSTELAFPYEGVRRYQRELMDIIAEGLSEDRPVLAMAPTGIGKTVSALLTGLRESLGRDGQLFFATSKRTQNELVERTFDDIERASGLAAGSLKAVTLRAKERMCPTGTLLCLPDVCPFLERLPERMAAGGIIEDILRGRGRVSPDEIYERAEPLKLCPFEVSLCVASRVDVIVGDYNYVYDPAVAPDGIVGANGSRAVVVIDEAHNLFERAREYYSPFLAKDLLERAAEDIRKGAFSVRRKDADQPLLDIVTHETGPKLFRELLACVERALVFVDDELGKAQEDLDSFSGGCAGARLSVDDWDKLAQESSKLMVRYLLHNRRHRIYRRNDMLLDIIRTVRQISELLALEDPALVPYVAGPKTEQGIGVGITCVNPAQWLGRRHRKALGTVAMSATLTPLDYYADVLGFGELSPVTESVPSPFPPENRRIVIVPTVSTTYRARARHYPEIARLIQRVFELGQGNHIAYFPSFAFLSQVKGLLDIPKGRLLAQKRVMDEGERARMLGKLRKGKHPSLLLAVMGGIFAEGIDLPGEAVVGAIIVGPGLPGIGFDRDAMRAYFDEHNGNGFAYAMLYPGMQRVIQSAGRVIRTSEDKGVIVLLGRRFTEPQYARCLPPDWAPDGVQELVSRDPALPVRAFWDYAFTETR